MSALSNYLENALLQELFNATNLAPPATHVALFTTDPTDAGNGTEVSGGSYARKLVSPTGGTAPAWAAAAENAPGYKVVNADAISFATASASWGTITHFGIFDAGTAGNLLMHGSLAEAKTVGSGDTFRFGAGDLTLRLE
jgi:hypothetical protein